MGCFSTGNTWIIHTPSNTIIFVNLHIQLCTVILVLVHMYVRKLNLLIQTVIQKNTKIIFVLCTIKCKTHFNQTKRQSEVGLIKNLHFLRRRRRLQNQLVMELKQFLFHSLYGAIHKLRQQKSLIEIFSNKAIESTRFQLNPKDSGILDSLPFSYFAMRKVVYNL